MQTVPRGSETSGFLKGDGALYQGDSRFSTAKDARPAGHDSGGIFKPTDDSIVQTTPFSAGRGWCGSCQTAIFYIFFLAVYLTTSIVSFIKLFDEDDLYDPTGGSCTAGTLSGPQHHDDTTCCRDSTNNYACHKYFDFEAHINTAFALCAVLPLIAILVGSLYYGFWWKPMSSLNGFHATIGTVFYAHLILILMCTGIIYYWMSEADGYNFTMTSDTTTGVITKTPIGVNEGRMNARKNDDRNEVFGALFVLNTMILAGSIAFPLTGLSMQLNEEDGRANRNVLGRRP